jgi:hypothetical protein
MRKKLKTPTPKLWSKDLPRLEAMALFPLLGPAPLKLTSPLPQLHLSVALPPLLPLELCIKNFKLYQIPGMPGAVVRYTFISVWFAT